jgi:hypothetical protein
VADCLDCEKTAAYAALLDDEEAPDVDPRGDELTRWSGLIAPYGKPTGDKRRFAVGSLENRPFPLPLKWQREDGQGHSRSVVIGTIEGADYSDDGVQAWGILLDPDPAVMPRLAEDVAEARLLLEKGTIGPSVDLSKMEFHQLDASEFAEGDPVEGRPEIEVTQGEFGAVTLVAIPAFAEARPFALEKIKVDAYESLVASVAAEVPVRRDWASVPVAFVDWAPHEFLMQEFADETLVAGAFLEQDTNTFPVAMVVDGELSVIPGAVAEAIAVFSRHEDQLPLSAAVRGTMKRALAVLAERCELPAPPWSKAALVASGVPLEPPREWFDTPEAPQPTPLTVTDDGRVYGHIAGWHTCHTGFSNQCVTAPRSASGYAYAHTGAVKTAEGDQVTVGRLTVGGGHASTAPGIGFRAAIEHYDNASTTAAIGRFRDGKHGIWFSGAVVPEATPQQIAQLRRHPPSGDWRTIGGTKEMILAHSVNAPGFPVVSAGMVRGEVTSMVAAGALLAAEDGTAQGEVTPSRQDVAVAAFADAARRTREYKAGMPFWLKKKVKGEDDEKDDDDDDKGGKKGEPFGGKKAKPFGKGGKK